MENCSLTFKGAPVFEHPIPPPVWHSILSFLLPDDLAHFSETCVFMWNYIEKSHLWSSAYLLKGITIQSPPAQLTWHQFYVYQRICTWKYICEKIQIVEGISVFDLNPINACQSIIVGCTHRAKAGLKKGTKKSETEFNKTIMSSLPTYIPPSSSTNSPPSSKPPSPYSKAPSSSKARSSSSNSPPSARINKNGVFIWDPIDVLDSYRLQYTSTRERFQLASSVIITYDVTNIHTFDYVSTWKKFVENARGGKYIPIILVGLQAECPRKVRQATVIKYARENGMAYTEVNSIGFNSHIPFAFAVWTVTKAFCKALLPFLCIDKDGLLPEKL